MTKPIRKATKVVKAEAAKDSDKAMAAGLSTASRAGTGGVSPSLTPGLLPLPSKHRSQPRLKREKDMEGNAESSASSSSTRSREDVRVRGKKERRSPHSEWIEQTRFLDEIGDKREQRNRNFPTNITGSVPLPALAVGDSSSASSEPRATTHSIHACLGIGGSNTVLGTTMRLCEVLPKDVVEAVEEDFGEGGTKAMNTRVIKWKQGPPEGLNSEIAAMIEPYMKSWWDAAKLAQDAAELSSYGINTMSEFARKMAFAETIVSAETYHRLEAKMVQLAEVRASWIEFTRARVAGRLKSPCTFLLARAFEEGRVSKFVGSDRVEVVVDVVEYIFECSSKHATMKEANPIHVVFGAPRMGKSRVLDEICSRVNWSEDCLAIPITFNSTTPLDILVRSVTKADVRREWLSRLVCSLCFMFCRDTLPFTNFYKMLDWQHITLDDVLTFATQLSGKKHVTIVADEASRFFDLPRESKHLNYWSELLNPMWARGNFSLVVSGFVSNTVNIVGALSGHPTPSSQLYPITKGTADSYADLRAAARRVTSFELYQSIRFCPGLMGLAIELNERKTLQSLVPPVVMSIRDSHNQLFDGYWDHVANAETFSSAVQISEGQLHQSGLDKCEESGIVLHEPSATGFRAILNPFFLTCFDKKGRSLKPLEAFENSLSKWAASPEDGRLKGAVLETLLVGALQLRASYMKSPMRASSFFELLSGRCVSVDNARYVSFKGANLDLEATVTSFPHHHESTDDQARRSRDEIQKCKTDVAKLISSGGFVARMSAKCNLGCDVVAIGSYTTPEDLTGKCCLMFETRFWESDSRRKPGTRKEATRKASLALLGILNNYPKVFKRVSFVYLTTCTVTDAIDYNCKLPFYAAGHETDSVLELITKLEVCGCIATVDVVHCVGGNHDSSNTFRNIMMQSLTYLVPTFDRLSTLTD